MAETTVRIAITSSDYDLIKTLNVDTRAKALHHAAYDKAWKKSFAGADDENEAVLQDKIIGTAKLPENERQVLKILSPVEKGAALVAEARRRIELDRMFNDAFDAVEAPFSWDMFGTEDGPYGRFRELLTQHNAVLEQKEGALIVSSTNGWGDEHRTVVDAIGGE